MQNNNKAVPIIGAGPCGLSASYHAQKAGYKVTLLEKMKLAGGRYGSRQHKNLVVDFRPHVYHAITKKSHRPYDGAQQWETGGY